MLKRHWKLSVTLAWSCWRSCRSWDTRSSSQGGRPMSGWSPPDWTRRRAPSPAIWWWTRAGSTERCSRRTSTRTMRPTRCPLPGGRMGPIPARSPCRWARGPSGWSSRRTGEDAPPDLSPLLEAAADTYALLPVQRRTWSGVTPVCEDGTFGVGGELEFGLRNWEAPRHPGTGAGVPALSERRAGGGCSRPGAAPGPDIQLCGGPGGAAHGVLRPRRRECA